MKTVLYLAMSLNGMIAGENDETPWSETEWELYRGAVEKAGNLIIGHKTYEVMKQGGEFSSFIVKPLCVVVANSPVNEDDNAQVVSELSQALQTVKEKGFNTALIAGGSKLATSFLEADLIDEVQLDIEPMLLGRGVPILHNSSLATNLALKEVKQLDEGVIHLVYAVEKEQK